MQPNRPELALLRGKERPEALTDWIRAFGDGDKELAKRYALALATFLGDGAGEGAYIGRLSPRTRTAYGFAITEFFEWITRERGRVIPPHHVTQKDAEDYAGWLATRPYTLEDEKLRDGDQATRLAIYETVKKLGTADITKIANALPGHAKREFTRDGLLSLKALHHELGRMVLHDLVVRSPTVAELRADDPRLGLDVFGVVVPEGNTERTVEIEYLFMYEAPRAVPVSRVTIALRLTALSSFWDVLATGENIPGGQAILRYNVFRPIKKRVQHGLASAKKEAASLQHQLTPEIVSRLLEVADGKQLPYKRDAALLWFLVLTGSRVTEALQVRRGVPDKADQHRWPGWFDGRAEPPAVVLVRKGGRVQRLPFPPFALKALYAFQADLVGRAAPPDAQSEDPEGRHYVPPDSPRWRFRDLLRDDAPLYPPVAFWGANSTANYLALRPNLPGSRSARIDYRRPMTRHGAEKMLKRLARKAGLTEADVKKVHPHALRAFAATAMSRMGKPLAEIQAILGHESITTTEKYIAEEDREVALSGQAEILGYISQQPRGVPRPPGVTPVIRTYGVEAREEPQEKAQEKPRKKQGKAAIAPAPRYEPELENMPAQSPVLPEPAEVLHETGEGMVTEVAGEAPPRAATEVRDGISPGAPLEVYAALEPTPGLAEAARVERQERIEFTRVNPRRSGEKYATLYEKHGREQVQQNAWLREHYDPWPLHYGLGEGSLLPWYARGNPRANGEVETSVADAIGAERAVRVPPLPVLSPDQVYPETATASLFGLLETLSSRWMETEPTRVFGLRQWFATFAYITAKLEKSTKEKYRWVPFDGLAKVGEDLRAHDDEYLAAWFEQNAGRYLTTVRQFKAAMKRPRKPEEGDAEDFMEAFTATSFEAVSQVEDVPEWFTSDDPIHDIYVASREEWDFFLTWLRSVTGAKLTPARVENRDDQKKFAAENREAIIARSRALLDSYYGYVTEIAEAKREGRDDDAEMFRVILHGGTISKKPVEGLTEQLAKLGVPDPATIREPRELRARVEAILGRAFPDAPVELADPNMLRSRLFDPEAFRIDEAEHTIRHTPEFRESFQEKFGRDSECVMRRAARGMWEYVLRHNVKITRGRERETQYTMLHAVMLAYVAWIVPCPADIEKAMGASGGADARKKSRAQYLSALNRTIRDTVFGRVEMDEDALIAEAEGSGLPAEEAARALDIAAVYLSTIAERTQQVPIERAIAGALKSQDLRVTVPRAELRPGVHRRIVRRNYDGDRTLLVPNEVATVAYRSGEVLVSHGVCCHALSLIPNAERVFPDPLHMFAAMVAG